MVIVSSFSLAALGAYVLLHDLAIISIVIGTGGFVLAYAILMPNLLSVISLGSGPKSEGAVMGVATLGSSAGAVSGPLLGGFIITRFGQGQVYLELIVLALAGAATALAISRQVNSSGHQGGQIC